MDILKKKIINYDLFEFMQSLRFDTKSPISILGSFALASQQYFSDIDMMTRIKGKVSVDHIYNRFKEIIDSLEKNKNAFWTEFKIQSSSGNKKKIFPKDNFSLDMFTKYFDNKGFCKLDLVYFYDYEFLEMSIIYDFSGAQFSKKSLINNIQSEIVKTQKEGKYYKTLKRIFSLCAIKGKKKCLEYLSTIFNSELGMLYYKYSRLQTILLVKQYYKCKAIKNMISAALNNLGYKPRLNIKSESDKLFKIINSQAKVILDNFKY